jgi:hypothetical protein
MIVNRRRRWAVALPPKTGSTSLLVALTAPPFNGVNMHPDWHHEVADPGPGYRVYASVRCPYSRAVSMYLQRGKDFPDVAGETFEQFVDGTLIASAGNPFCWSTQARWLGGLPLAGILRLEAIYPDLAAANLSLGRPFSLPWENLGLPGGAWQRYYAEAPGTMEVVRAWGAEDFDRFGYDPGDE